MSYDTEPAAPVEDQTASRDSSTSRELTGSPEALMRCFIPRHLPHGPVFRPTRKQRRQARLERLDNWQRALRRGLAAARMDALKITPEDLKNLEEGRPVRAKQRLRNLRRRLRQGRVKIALIPSRIASVESGGSAHFCAEFNRLRTERKRRAHLRRANLAKPRGPWVCACTKALEVGLGSVR